MKRFFSRQKNIISFDLLYIFKYIDNYIIYYIHYLNIVYFSARSIMLDTEKSFLNLVNLNQFWIVITLFRLI